MRFEKYSVILRCKKKTPRKKTHPRQNDRPADDAFLSRRILIIF